MFEKDAYIKLKFNHKFDLKNLTTDEVAAIYQGLDLITGLPDSQNKQNIQHAKKLKDAIKYNRK